jgi:acylphosphatase
MSTETYMKTLHLFITGRVQGVGYRRFLQKHAKELAITGWVRNRQDRRVEAVIQANTGMPEEDEKRLDDLIKRSWKGPFLADVTDIQIEEVDKTEKKQYVDFEILETL